MKKSVLILAAVSAMILAGCHKIEPVKPNPGKDIPAADTTGTDIPGPGPDTTVVDPPVVDPPVVDPPVVEPVQFEAEIAALTKTTLNGVRVEWESGDEIDIVSGAGIVTYVATPSASDPRIASFAKKNGSDPEPTPLPAAYGMGSYVALYPSGIGVMDASGLVVTMPSKQLYNDSGSLKNVNVMFASSDNYSLSFQNGFGILALEIKGDKSIKSILVETQNNNISGLFDLSTFLMSTDPAKAFKSVELDCGSGVALSPSGTKFYIGIPAQTIPVGELSITATTSDGKSASLTNKGAAAAFQMGHISPYSWTPAFDPIPIPGEDYLDAFKSGSNLSVGGKTYNLSSNSNYAVVRLSQVASGADFNANYLAGQYDVVFLDYVLPDDEGADRLAVSGGNLTPADGVAIVSRYSSHQSEFDFTGSMVMPKGSFGLRNVCVRTNTWAIQTKDMQKNDCRFDIEDCSFYITPPNGAQGGLVSDNCSSTGDVSTVLGYFTLKNSVVVRHNDYNHPMFTMRVGSYGTIPYKEFAVENNAFLYESATAGREVCNSSLFYLSSDSEVKNSSLEFTFRNNSVYGYKGSGTILACCDPKVIVCENNVVEAKLTTKIFFLNIIYPYSKLTSTTSRLGGNYANNSGAVVNGVDFVNGDALKAKFAIGPQNLVATGVSPYFMMDTTIGYLGLDANVISGAGCSYDTKTWRSWSVESGGGTEGYGAGHNPGDFGWK